VQIKYDKNFLICQVNFTKEVKRMFSAKLFNQITIALAIVFFLSATISTLADIRQENSIRMQFTELVQDVDVFNSEHSSLLNKPEQQEPVKEISPFTSGKQALVTAYSNYENATSYYNESYGRMNFSALNFPFEIELWIKNMQYENGDFIQEIVAKEVGTLFGGKKGAMIAYYKKSDNVVYRNFTWNVTKQENKWVPRFTSHWSAQTLSGYIAEFGAAPGTPIYEVTNKTTVEELFFQKVKGSGNVVKEYHVQYKLNPILSTKLYISFITYVLDIVENDFVKSLSFKELTVSAIVDKNGNLSMTRYKELFDFTVMVRQWGGIHISATCHSEITYLYTLFNEPIPYDRPAIN
jgi:hypothetical protein